jgi:bis(5'-nucleosyl)-tetraphosphatase (symmetrical)
MAVYAIGDVQGCFTSLLALLEAITFDRTRDQLWFAGDLVNRGPHSLEVLRFVRELGEHAVTVLGNHDVHLLTVAHGLSRLKATDTFMDVLAAPDGATLLTWLRQQPLLHYDATRGVMLVHAGLPPQWTLATARTYAAEVEDIIRSPEGMTFLKRFAGNTVSQWRNPMAPEERQLYIANCLTRLRYCDAAGQLALSSKGPPGSQPSPYLPWFAIPGRMHAGPDILFGHWSTLGPCTVPGVYPLDTGCVWGGTLTALCLETREWIRVACRDPLGDQSAAALEAEE